MNTREKTSLAVVAAVVIALGVKWYIDNNDQGDRDNTFTTNQFVAPNPDVVSVTQYAKNTSISEPELTAVELNIKQKRYALYAKALEAKTSDLEQQIQLGSIAIKKANKEANKSVETSPAYPMQSYPIQHQSFTGTSGRDTAKEVEVIEDTRPEDFAILNKISGGSMALVTVNGKAHYMAVGSSGGGVTLTKVRADTKSVEIQGVESGKRRTLYLIPGRTRTRSQPKSLDRNDEATETAG